VQIACERCGAIHDLELPKGVLEKGRSVRFRCTSCGHGFKVAQQGALVASPPSRTPPSNSASPALSNPSPLTAGAAMILRQEGAAYHIPNIATLQRWVAERRVNELDELDLGGGNTVQAKELPELRVFFELVQIAEHPTAAALPATRTPDFPNSQPQPPRAIAPSLPLNEPATEAESPALDPIEPDEPELPSSDLADSDSLESPAAETPSEVGDSLAGWAPPDWTKAEEEAAPAEDAWSPPAWANSEVPPDGATEEVGAGAWAPPNWANPEPENAASSNSSGWSPPAWAASTPESKPVESGGWAPPSWASSPSPESGNATSGWAPPSWASEAPKKAPPAEPAKPQRPQEDSLLPDVGDEAWSAPLEGVSPEDAPLPAKAKPLAGNQGGSEELEDWFSDNAFEDPDDAPAPDPVISPAPWDLPAVEAEKPPARKEKAQEPPPPTPKPEPRSALPASPPEPTPPKPWIWVGLAFAAVAIGAFFLWRPSSPPPTIAPAPAPVSAPAPAQPSPTPLPTTPPPQPLPLGADPQPVPAPAPPPVPAPPPQPAPSPKVAAEETREVGVQATINKGWKQVSSKNWDGAEVEFRKAIAQRENSGPAHYGLGYVLDRKGDAEGSLRELCRAQRYAGSDAELRREITAGLNRLGKECD
jgi:hypothetical protein